MERIIVGVVAAVIAAAALVYFVKLLALYVGGERKTAEVVAVREPKQKVFVHRLRFEHGGEIVEHDDKTGYSQPFSVGDEQEIICSKRHADKFEYAVALKRNMVISLVLAAMSVLIVLRFAFFVTD